VPSGSRVFIPMSGPVAEKIIGRRRDLPIDFRFVASNRPVWGLPLNAGTVGELQLEQPI